LYEKRLREEELHGLGEDKLKPIRSFAKSSEDPPRQERARAKGAEGNGLVTIPAVVLSNSGDLLRPPVQLIPFLKIPAAKQRPS
jgi:hypothetical protein